MDKLRYRCRIGKQIHPYFQGFKAWYGGEILSDLMIRIIAMLFPVFYGILLEKVILKCYNKVVTGVANEI